MSPAHLAVAVTDPRGWLAASYAQAGKIDLARACAADLLQRKPDFSARRLLAKILVRREDVEHLADGLRKAGLE